MMLNLEDTSALFALLSDATRLRLLSLLDREELSVAELTQITELSQSRVSTHLGRLREAALVDARREGSSTRYRRRRPWPPRAAELWSWLSNALDDGAIASDGERLEALLAARAERWPDAVAGQMERHYSPGRTWEASARGLVGLLRLGDVLDAGSGDGTLAALLAPRARSLTCLDRSETVLEAARARLKNQANVHFTRGDVASLPFEDSRFDQVMLFNVLTCTHEPAQAIAEAKRVLRPGGDLAIVTLRAHAHAEVAASYGHVLAGFETGTLGGWLKDAGLEDAAVAVAARERRKPHFEVITAFARRPGRAPEKT